MKKFGAKWVGGALAVCLVSSLVVACGDEAGPDNGGGDSSSGGGDADTGGSGGSGGGGDAGGSGGTGAVGGGGMGGDGMGGDGPTEPEEPAVIQSKTTRVVTNMLNAFGSVYASDDKLYVAGVTDTSAVSAAQANGNLRLAVWRFNADGTLDTTFGTAGVATAAAVVNPGTAYDIIEWQEGSFGILISGGAYATAIVPFASGTFGAPVTVSFGWDDPADFAIALADKVAAVDAVCPTAKTECDAALTTVATTVCYVGGVNYDVDDCAAQVEECADATEACQDEYPLAVAPNFSQRPAQYSSWGMALDESGTEPKLVVFAAGPAADAETSDRWDADRWITRLNADDLTFDTSFNDGAPYSLDVSGAELADGARRGVVHADGTIVSSGYTNFGTGKGNHIALIRLLPSGEVDEDFGFSDDLGDYSFTPGQTHYNPFRAVEGFAEAYGVAILSDDSYVTTGYGTSNMFVPSVSVDIVATRVTADGTALVPTFGGKPGAVVTYPGSFAVQSEADNPMSYVSAEERGRDVVALADDRTIHAGFYDGLAAMVVLTPDGKRGGQFTYSWTTNFFSVNTDADGARVVATSDEVAKVVGTSYARTLIATLDVIEPAD